MVKSGKLRSLIKGLETKYVQDDACCKPLHSNMGSCNSSCVHLESTHIHQNRAKLRSLTALKENVKLVEVEYGRTCLACARSVQARYSLLRGPGYSFQYCSCSPPCSSTRAQVLQDGRGANEKCHHGVLNS